MSKYILPLLFLLCLTAQAREHRPAHRPHRPQPGNWHRPHRHHGQIFRSYFVPGYWGYRTEVVLVEPARYEDHWVEPEYGETNGEDGKRIKVKIRDGYYKKVYIPPRYETRIVPYWIPGYWAVRVF